MRADVVEEVLQESMSLQAAGDPELVALSVAILLEDTLGLVLTDDEIDLSVLSDPEAVRSLIHARRLDGA